MNIILSPEKNNSILKGYHKSSKAIIPLAITSLGLHYFKHEEGEKISNSINALNFGFHSYVSTSCVITDYVKPLKIARGCRALSLGLHSVAVIGYLSKLYKK